MTLTDEQLVGLVEQITGWTVYFKTTTAPQGHFYSGHRHVATVPEMLHLCRTLLASSSTASVSEPDNSQAVALREVQEQRRFEAYFRDGETREFWENANPRQIANAAWFAALSTPASKEPK